MVVNFPEVRFPPPPNLFLLSLSREPHSNLASEGRKQKLLVKHFPFWLAIFKTRKLCLVSLMEREEGAGGLS